MSQDSPETLEPAVKSWTSASIHPVVQEPSAKVREVLSDVNVHLELSEIHTMTAAELLSNVPEMLTVLLLLSVLHLMAFRNAEVTVWLSRDDT